MNMSENGQDMSGRDPSEKKDPSFIRETIKGKSRKRQPFIVRLLMVCIMAAAAAAVAAVVFVYMVPVVEKTTGRITPTPRVTIPAETVTVTATPTPSPAEKPTFTPTPSKTDEPSPEPSDTEEPEKTVVPEPAEKPEDGSDEEKKEGESRPQDLSIEQFEKLQDELMKVAEEASDAVVTVTAISSQMDYFNQSVENKQQISGSIIARTDDALYILTESGIIQNIERIQVTFSDGYIADAIFVKDDPDTGLAVLRVNNDTLTAETLDKIACASLGNSYFADTGDTVIALGSPNGYPGSVSFGKITSTSSVIQGIDCEYNLLITDIIGSGEGSGVLVDLGGNVIGVIDQSFSNSGTPVVTCIAISQLKTLLEHLSNGEKRPYIGIKASEVTASVSEITGIPKGIIVTEVEDESPAFFAGLTELDVITQIGEEKIANMAQYKTALEKLKTGDTAVVTALRKGAEGYTDISFEITIGEI